MQNSGHATTPDIMYWSNRRLEKVAIELNVPHGSESLLSDGFDYALLASILEVDNERVQACRAALAENLHNLNTLYIGNHGHDVSIRKDEERLSDFLLCLRNITDRSNVQLACLINALISMSSRDLVVLDIDFDQTTSIGTNSALLATTFQRVWLGSKTSLSQFPLRDLYFKKDPSATEQLSFDHESLMVELQICQFRLANNACSHLFSQYQYSLFLSWVAFLKRYMPDLDTTRSTTGTSLMVLHALELPHDQHQAIHNLLRHEYALLEENKDEALLLPVERCLHLVATGVLWFQLPGTSRDYLRQVLPTIEPQFQESLRRALEKCHLDEAVFGVGYDDEEKAYDGYDEKSTMRDESDTELQESVHLR